MKKLLIFALVATAIFGCKRDVNPIDDVLNPNSEVISLISGQPSLVALGRAANQGDRVHFESGDLLGLFAAYAKADDADAPDWAEAGAIVSGVDPQTGRYFDNKPAFCNIAGLAHEESAAADKRHAASFAWGDDGLGGVDNNQTYPKGDKNIFVYAYYPYDKDNVTNVTVDAVKGPKVKLTLNEGTIIPVAAKPFTVAITADTFVPTQADVLHASGESKLAATSVKRTDKLDSLVFGHALAQFQIRLQRPVGSRVSEYTKIEFTTFFKGDMTLTSGAIVPQKVKTTAEDDHKLTYVITPVVLPPVLRTAPNVKIPEIGTGEDYVPLVVLNKPLMLLPLTLADFKESTLTIWLKYDDDKVVGDDQVADVAKEFKVNLSALTNFDLEQGKLNILTLTLAETEIKLEGNVALWSTEVNSTEVGVE